MTSTLVRPTADLTQRGTLRALMVEWMAVLQVVAETCDRKCAVAMWQPHQAPADLPLITNWLQRSPYRIMDVGRGRDSITLLTRVLAGYGEPATDDEVWMDVADTFRAVVDPLLWTPGARQLLGNTAYKASRQDMYMEVVPVGDTLPLRSITFTMVFDVDRKLRVEA